MTTDRHGVPTDPVPPLQHLPGRGAADLVPGVTVVVASPTADGHLDRCLASLASQHVPADAWELVVVFPGLDDEWPVVDDLVAKRPDLHVRTIRSPWTGVASARNAGLAAARHDHVAFVDPHDWVGPGWLAGLVDLLEPGVIPVGHRVDDTASDPGGAVPGARLPAGALTGIPAAFEAVDDWGGAILPTSPALQVGHDPTVGDGHEFVFLAGVLAQVDGVVATPDLDPDQMLHRGPRPADHDADDADGPVDGDTVGGGSVVGPALDIIERLEALRTAGVGIDGLGGEVLDMAMVAQVSRLHDHRAAVVATGDVGGDAALVAELDRRPIQALPYTVLNEGLADDLAIGYAFPPTTDTSATVAGKRIRQLGRIVDVVRNPLHAIRGSDESLRRISGPYTATEHVVETKAAFMDWGTMCAFSEAGLAEVTAARTRPYRSVYSRAHFAASHLMAARYKLLHPETHWIAEFSDPLSRDIWDKVRGSVVLHDDPVLTPLREELARRGFEGLRSDTGMEWCEWMAYGLADEIIFTNDNQQAYMLGYVPDPALARRAEGVATVRPHPTLDPPFYHMVESDYELDGAVANIGYFGNFYATRGLDSILTAMAKVDVDRPGALHLHVFTSNGEEMDRAAAEAGVGHLVTAGSYVPYLEFLNLTTRFDALVVNDADTAGTHHANPFLPSKWSDYRGSGRGVWGIVEPDSPLSRQPLTWQSTRGNMEEIEASLRDIVASVLDRD